MALCVAMRRIGLESLLIYAVTVAPESAATQWESATTVRTYQTSDVEEE